MVSIWIRCDAHPGFFTTIAMSSVLDIRNRTHGKLLSQCGRLFHKTNAPGIVLSHNREGLFVADDFRDVVFFVDKNYRGLMLRQCFFFHHPPAQNDD